jgi:hypothetical protein
MTKQELPAKERVEERIKETASSQVSEEESKVPIREMVRT